MQQHRCCVAEPLDEFSFHPPSVAAAPETSLLSVHSTTPSHHTQVPSQSASHTVGSHMAPESNEIRTPVLCALAAPPFFLPFREPWEDPDPFSRSRQSARRPFFHPPARAVRAARTARSTNTRLSSEKMAAVLQRARLASETAPPYQRRAASRPRKVPPRRTPATSPWLRTARAANWIAPSRRELPHSRAAPGRRSLSPSSLPAVDGKVFGKRRFARVDNVLRTFPPREPTRGIFRRWLVHVAAI